MPARAVGVGLLALGLLGCASTGRVADPPAWTTPGFYGLTRKAARAARGPQPTLLVRLEDAQMPEPRLRWIPIAVWIARDPGIDAIPFVPVPDRELRVEPRLEECTEVEVFANPTGSADGAVAPGEDVLVEPLPAARWAPAPAQRCALVLYYGTPEGRSGAWIQVVAAGGLVAEQLVVAPEPRYWALVPLSAVAETTWYAVLLGVALTLMGLSGGVWIGG